ncbi:MAG: ATP-dependent helicase [Candidatus Levybacteria bacterium]|nr:ATP-dependent helicase [Candidatus Levybacteria bacterium]
MITNTTLNSEQLKAVRHNKGPLLIIAGAGTGKTTVITERIKYLILKRHVSPSQILALTFTDKAAREMEERVDIALPYGYTQLWISTFHSFCDRILKNEAIHIGLNPSYKLLTEAEAVLLLRKNLFEFDFTYFRPLGNPNKFLEGMLQHFSRLKDEDVSPEEYLQYSRKFEIPPEEIKKIRELANAYMAYEKLKTKENVMDFSDLISNTLKLFRERLSILKLYQDQFRYILVDEFQDTNFAQNQLVILLAGDSKNITVVGDDDQAIYRWRGAAISNIIQFKSDFPKSKTVILNKNYRSTQEILNASYRLIQNNNPDRLEAKENINKKLESVRGIAGDKVEFLFGQRVEDEADLVSEKIIEFIEKKNSKVQYKDIAILVRANDHSQPFQRAFSRKNIPFQFLGPGQLFHQDEIKDLIAYLKVLYNAEDSASLYRVMNISSFHFDPIDIASMLSFARRKNYSLFEMLNKIEETFMNKDFKEKVEKFTKMIKNHIKRIPKDTAGQILYYFLEDSGLIKNYLKSKSIEDERKSQNIARFFDKLKTYEAEHADASIYSVVDWIDLSMQMGESPLATNIDWTENNAVNILTIHSSKGLEFPIVFVVNLVSQRFPTRERKEQIPIPKPFIKEILPSGDYHLEEERRLFYVALTRAKDNLFLSSANYYGEGKRERKVSPFVYETLPLDYVNKIIQKRKASKEMGQLSFLDLSQINNPPSIFSASRKILSTNPITYLSYSQIQTFEICPLHYKLKYLLKIPTAQTSALSFGTSIHATLRDLYQKLIRKEEISKGDIILYLKKNWVNEGYGSKSHEKKALDIGEKIIENYLKNNLDKKNLPLSLELPFTFPIKNSVSKGVGLKIGGRIDRIDRLDDNKIEILDYKTRGNVPEEDSLKDNMQLTIYALAATQVPTLPLNRKTEDVVLSLYFLEKDIKLTTMRSAEDLQKAKELLMEKAKEIEKSDFSCSHSAFCQNCEYKIICSTSSK